MRGELDRDPAVPERDGSANHRPKDAPTREPFPLKSRAPDLVNSEPLFKVVGPRAARERKA